MSLTSPAALCAAIHAILSGDTGVRATLGQTPRLYDHVPTDPVFPYLTYGAVRTVDVSGDDCGLSNHTINLHIWSRYCGKAETLAVVAAVSEALTRKRLRARGVQAVSIVNLYADVFRARDGRTLHGVLRLSITVGHALLEAA